MMNRKNRFKILDKIRKKLPTVSEQEIDKDITKAMEKSELWVHQNPKVWKSIQKGLEDAKNGRTIRVENLDYFLDNL